MDEISEALFAELGIPSLLDTGETMRGRRSFSFDFPLSHDDILPDEDDMPMRSLSPTGLSTSNSSIPNLMIVPTDTGAIPFQPALATDADLNDKKKQVQDMLQSGKSTRAVAMATGVPQTTVMRWKKKYTTAPEKVKKGRPVTATTEQAVEAVRQIILSNKRTTIKMIHTQLQEQGFVVSKATVGRIVKKLKDEGCTAITKALENSGLDDFILHPPAME
ncbi:Homeodomain-like domain [Carpediemonas membranifera]|uniref:Homeodomain-like domain n=1 Tax=Carpediemonas membranifera TaxID=201153 RepID=A0A8J6E270_9EUKA|nr:Homeodomain-like domain [Carpediemonas membranifera]|eukprot:KAG9391537.1 Homeodomain-like domain [Carpediemonas membranifera]